MCTTVLECDRPRADLEIKLDPDDQAPGEARRFMRHHLTERGYPLYVEVAELIISELATNAIRAAPWAPIIVALRFPSGRPILECWDVSPNPPVKRPLSDDATGGRGLHVVDNLAADTGCDSVGCWKCVWALLDGLPQ